MGNVAHDLKTPLHSIKADLEVLNLLMSKIPKSAIDKAVALLQSSFFQQTFEFQSLFNIMDATCKFMMMSINRSQDFMKASNNIGLFPVLNTFDLHAAVEISVTCIKHIESDRLIIVHPLDDNICSYLVSDEHWVMENLLCLLSNAMKYSNNGHVDVHMKVIDAPLDDPSRRTSTSSSPTEKEECRRNQLTIIKGSDSFRRLSKDTDIARRDLAVLTTKRMILVTVEDSGIGISEEARKDLFQPFKQAQRMAGGTGLGLFSLLKRVEALNGEVKTIECNITTVFSELYTVYHLSS
jgi:signal transduction histidine kinase